MVKKKVGGNMFDFNYAIPTDIHVGVGAEAKAGVLMAPYAKKVMMLYGSERIFRTGIGGIIEDSLKDAGIDVLRYGGVTPNGDTDFIDEAVKHARENGVDGLLAIGGGSVIDTAKAISAAVNYKEGNTVDLYTNPEAMPESFLPIGAVVTIPGTASESNPMSVVTNTATGIKLIRPFNEVKPKFAIMDPALTTSVSPFQTASGGFDMFAHAFERYFDMRRGSQVFDALTMALMEKVVRLLPQVLADPENTDLRAEMMLASSVAHNDTLGPGGDFACHGISHTITKYSHLAHGAALAVVFPVWCRYVADMQLDYEHRQRLEKFFAGVFGAADVEQGISKLTEFIKSIGLPDKMELDSVDIDAMVEDTMGGAEFIGGGFAALGASDVRKILENVTVVA